MFVAKLEEWLKQRPPLDGYARCSAMRAVLDKKIDRLKAIDLILKHGDELLTLCKKKNFISSGELRDILHTHGRAGAVPSLDFWGLPYPSVDKKSGRKLYNSQAIIDWLNGLKEARKRK